MMECVNGNMFKELSVFIVFECWLGRKKKRSWALEWKKKIVLVFLIPGRVIYGSDGNAMP